MDFVKMVQNGPKWSNIFKMVLYSPIGSKTVQNGPKSVKWSKMVQNGSKWSKKCKMVQNGQNIFQNDPIWSKFI